ncbi:hypothetical protein [Micromonospora qiuiae]|uniref:hypothetical protein n=1 Tax=Micromonospora qiuiae TaxID=502268 RepID=UPI00194F5C66|nr:hypothetical protein [Micromonospora qiuiae]
MRTVGDASPESAPRLLALALDGVHTGSPTALPEPPPPERLVRALQRLPIISRKPT